MAITKSKKSEIFEKVKDIASKESVVFVNFHKVPVQKIAEIRNTLRESDVSYYVAKKTLVKKVFAEAGIEGSLPELDGELALAYSNDQIAPAREIYAFQKSLNGAISILGGTFEKGFKNKVEIEELAKIPSLQVLRGMFVNVINSPIQGFAVAIKAIADKKTA